ncbi:MAG: hypothetical protein JXA92_10345 [candidate division Zixibacteria bacterium]|nr:hypothetical protein [candidate division Zixibacteria bacterium]
MSEMDNKPAAGSSYLRTLALVSVVLVVIAAVVYLAIVEQWDTRTAALRVLSGIIGGGVCVLIYTLITGLFGKRPK